MKIDGMKYEQTVNKKGMSLSYLFHIAISGFSNSFKVLSY